MVVSADKNKKAAPNDKLAVWLYGLLLAAFLCIFLFELARMSYEWLRYGESEKVILSDLIQSPAFGWVGIQKVFSFIWSLDIWVLSFVGAMFTGWLWSEADEGKKKT